MKTKRLTSMALLCGIALILHVIEAQIPPVIPIPGVRLGISNIVTVFAVFAMGRREGAWILFARIVLGCIFAGRFSSILYAGAGGLLAIGMTALCKCFLTRKQLWVAGVLGAIAHSIGQLMAAAWITGTLSVWVYLPILLVCSILTGLCTGTIAGLLLNRGDRVWKTFLP